MTGWDVTLTLGGRPGRDERTMVYQTRRVPGDHDAIGFGRDRRADVVFATGNVSRLHCFLFVRSADEVMIKDAGSTNGTHVNGRHVSLGPFGLKDRLYLGDYVIQLVKPPEPTTHRWAVPVEVSKEGGPPTLQIVDRPDFFVGGTSGHVPLPGDDAHGAPVRIVVDAGGRMWRSQRYDSLVPLALGEPIQLGPHVVRVAGPPARATPVTPAA